MNDLDAVAQACSQLLESSPAAESVRNYLSGRVLPETIKKFNFGYYPNQDNIEALTAILDENILVRARLRYEKLNCDGISRKVKCSSLEHHNLIIPYKDTYNNTVALVGRTLLSKKEMEENKISKYKNTSFEKKSHIFGLNEAKLSILKKNAVLIVEGQFDAIVAHEHGITNTVALGSANMSLYQLGLIMRYTDNIYLLLDNDDAGKLGMERILDRCGTFANMVKKQIPLGYKDLDEYLRDNKNIDFNTLIK